jgi:glutamate-1-semialdehyde 2,1-aminomutase
MAIKLYKVAKKVLVGGVNSPVRSFKNIGINPIFIKNAKGSKIYDIDGNEYIDFCMGWGSIILGHANEKVIKNIRNVINNGINFGLTTKSEIELANLIKSAIPSIERIRFTNSGTEAVMSALRLARAFTKKKKIIKFDGCYHGHFDSLLVSAGSGVSDIYNSTSDGVPMDFIKNTISVQFNNIKLLKKVIEKNYRDIACVIVEPIPGNMGLIVPENEFLYEMRKLTEKYDILLIFDEIITGFRLNFGGVQNLLNIKPDLTCLGKIIGGGLPIGAFGGKKEIMKLLAPEGNVYQAGTFSGNPVVMISGLSTLQQLRRKREIYDKMKENILIIKNELKKIKNLYFSNYGSMFTLFFIGKDVKNYDDIKKCDLKRFKRWYKKMLNSGIFLPPSQYETSFISVAHSLNDIEKFIFQTKKNLK